MCTQHIIDTDYKGTQYDVRDVACFLAPNKPKMWMEFQSPDSTMSAMSSNVADDPNDPDYQPLPENSEREAENIEDGRSVFCFI